MRPVPTMAATNTPPVPSEPTECSVTPSQPRTHHTAVANVDYDARAANVSQRIDYTNTTGVTLKSIDLAAASAAFTDAFLLDTVTVNGTDVDPIISGVRISLPLLEPIAAGCAIHIQLKYLVAPPAIDAVTRAKGYFGHSERQLNLSYWLTTVAPFIDGEWVVNQPQTVGEQSVLDVASWDVSIHVLNAPPGVNVAGPGMVRQTGNQQWRFLLDRARDFSVSISPQYRVLRRLSDSGKTIELYAFADTIRQINDGTTVDTAEHAVDEALSAFNQFEALFGPYPYDRLVIVQGDFSDGMEFSGLVYVSTSWFYSYPGGIRNYLTLITVHEVSHQWWYAQVGNDAALTPWLDEALATYSEYIYLEEFYPDSKDWWWSFRVGAYSPTGAVDSTVYEFTGAREYINAVYLRGVQMLHQLRDDIGTDAFFDLLSAYANHGAGKIATARTFWELLTPEQWQLTETTRNQFFRDPTMGLGAESAAQLTNP